jgi:hypothetical protein
MATCRLRLYPSDQEEVQDSMQEATVSIRLGELYPLLSQAARSNLRWLQDFEEDEIRVTPDFYDVIRAFGQLRPSA